MLVTITLSLLIPITMFLFGLILWFSPAGNINNAFGYRTKRSMANQEAWNYAQKTSGRIMSLTGLICIPVSYWLIQIIDLDPESLLIVMLSLEMLALFLPLAYVEYKLKKRFS